MKVKAKEKQSRSVYIYQISGMIDRHQWVGSLKVGWENWQLDRGFRKIRKTEDPKARTGSDENLSIGVSSQVGWGPAYSKINNENEDNVSDV